MVITLALMSMGLLLSRQLTSERMLYGTLAYTGLFFLVYSVLRLRFFYATVHGFVSFLVLLLAVTWAGIPSTFSMMTLIFFGLIVNVFGAFACYMAEMMSRIHFIQGEQLQEEQDKVEQLLLNVLPAEIASRLKQQETIADSFDNATVLFADLVGFTALSQKIPPEELVDLLNGLFTCFDELVEKYGAEKIKTIGDAYMAAAGIPKKRTDHALVIACLALEMQEILGHFNDTYGYTLGLRIGIHSGPVVAGVIGRSRFLYDLWGDTVNTASRMESHGEEGHIQVSHDSYLLLKDSFIFEPRGAINVKGKGSMKTWWLVASNM
ncbi:MAG: adenylate cyclase [Deltaproteobacteria bacterium]|nr:MAG: adenylate cyclase [Deltaproteobacteria bacterium]